MGASDGRVPTPATEKILISVCLFLGEHVPRIIEIYACCYPEVRSHPIANGVDFLSHVYKIVAAPISGAE